jgi:hypothetical protein
MKFYNAFLVLLTLIIMVSCSTKTTEHGNDNDDIESRNSKILKTELKEFFNHLRAEDLENCIAYFSDSLLNNVGKEAISEGLNQRNSQFGLSDSSQIYYVRKNAQASSYTCFVRSFYSGEKESLSYDLISLNLFDDKVKITSLEFSANPYCDAMMANDTLSEINQYLKLVYKTFNQKGIDEAYQLLDPAVAETMSREKFVQAYDERKPLFANESKFTVKSVWTETMKGTPVINMIIESVCSDSEIYIDELLVSDRMGKYYIGRFDRKVKGKSIVEEIPRPAETELRPFADAASSFYNLLAENNIDKIVEQIDKNVFLNNDYNVVKNSFSARNVYYGVPTGLNNTNVKSYKIDADLVVDFNFSVTNSLGKKSYEKVSVIRREGSTFLIYGYDFRDQPF